MTSSAAAMSIYMQSGARAVLTSLMFGSAATLLVRTRASASPTSLPFHSHACPKNGSKSYGKSSRILTIMSRLRFFRRYSGIVRTIHSVTVHE
jgi:hypothetical protein